MKVIGIDAGKAGWIIIRDELNIIETLPMPLRKVIDKEAVKVFKHKDKKILIKSGSHKGTRAKIIKTKEKSHFELDEITIYTLIEKYVNIGYKVAIEAQSGRTGNSSKASTTISFNYGKMICILELLKVDYKEINPLSWKKYFSLDISASEKKHYILNYALSKDGKREFEKYKKQKSIDKAYELGLKNITKHDEAEAFLISEYYIRNLKEEKINEK